MNLKKDTRVLNKRIKILDIRIVVNANKKDYEIVEEIAKTLNVQIGRECLPYEYVEAQGGFIGDIEHLKRGLV
jgi:3-deoxy-D-manno-octulosonate 8-phosphate phosphatase KdsC-like HAD superfamily phosphatase